MTMTTLPAPRRGRPPGTSRRKIEVIALRLFSEQGFEQTSIDQISTAAGINKRTFFRYYESKSAILWNDFDREVEQIREAFRSVLPDTPLMSAIRQVVVASNHYSARDVPELRARMNLLTSIPALAASAAPHYNAWELAVTDFAATRLDLPADSLYPLAIGHATLAACRAAFDRWVARADADLPTYLDLALTALAAGFAQDQLPPEPRSHR